MAELPERNRRRYTWTDYRTWPDDERWEIIGGRAYAMSPSPGFRHQAVSAELAAALVEQFRGKPCRPICAPIDVRLSEADVVQPDILVVCNEEQIKQTHIEGAPALVVEIVSPSSELRDRHDKLALYARFGVKEYWIVTPFPSLVEVYRLDGDSYRVHGVYRKGEVLHSATFPDLAVDLTPVFGFPLEPEEQKLDRPPASPAAPDVV
jgi:Uma2 family endonuclease